MKTAVSIITPEVRGEAPLALLEGSFAERLAKAAAYGYRGVELVTCDPAALDLTGLLRQLRAAGLETAAVATGFIAASRGLTLVSPDPEIRRRAVSLLGDLIRLAAALGTKTVTVGSFRGTAAPVGGCAPAKDILHAALAAVEPLALDLGVTLAVEPIVSAESDLLTNAAEVCAFLDNGGYRAVKLLLDSYHVFQSETDPLKVFCLYRDRLVHVHLADSRRLALGLGSIDFLGMERVLREIGYGGWQSAEIARSNAPDENARCTASYLQKLEVLRV